MQDLLKYSFLERGVMIKGTLIPGKHGKAINKVKMVVYSQIGLVNLIRDGTYYLI
jgi:hypothetical protein